MSRLSGSNSPSGPGWFGEGEHFRAEYLQPALTVVEGCGLMDFCGCGGRRRWSRSTIWVERLAPHPAGIAFVHAIDQASGQGDFDVGVLAGHGRLDESYVFAERALNGFRLHLPASNPLTARATHLCAELKADIARNAKKAEEDSQK